MNNPSFDFEQGRNRRRIRQNKKLAALAWLMGAAVLCLIVWAITLQAIIK